MGSGQEENSVDRLDPLRWVDDHGQVLFHYALLRVGNTDVAEDLVQETFLTALRAKENFAGRSTERTWLTGILRNKIFEYYRSSNKKQDVETERHEEVTRTYFDKTRHWKELPLDWKADPENIAENREFWEIFHTCMNRLSEALASTFALREMDDLECEDICRRLEISSSSLWARLHRARMQLRQCLEKNWFVDSE